MKLTEERIEMRMRAFEQAAKYLEDKLRFAVESREQYNIAANQIRNWGEEWKKKTLETRKP